MVRSSLLVSLCLFLSSTNAIMVPKGWANIPPGSNPFQNVIWHADRKWVKAVRKSADILAAKGDKATQAAALRVANIPTFVWIDSARAAQYTVDTYLSRARFASWSNKSRPQLATMILYNLPDRDCSAKASAGELSGQQGLNGYMEWVDTIANKLAAFPDVRIVLIIEPDAVPNMVTSGSDLKSPCSKAKANHIAALRYAITRFQMPHVAIYLDAGHGGWLGWEQNSVNGAKTIAEILSGLPANATIRGFSTNKSNFLPLRRTDVAGKQDPALGRWQWNPGYDCVNFVATFGENLKANKVVPNKFLIDTSRNGVLPAGWTGDEWCNVKGAGLGERPTANTGIPNVDAFIWGKTPGESDGTSDRDSPRFDDTCAGSLALQPAPEAGQWFHDYFVMLLKNANPSV